MNRNKIFSFLTAGLALAFTACNNSAENTSGADTTSLDSMNTANTAPTTTTSTTDYSAMADSIESNSKSGYYLNPRTGKPLTLKVDRSTGAVTDAGSGEPVWRYVDRRSWWVYGDHDNRWDTMGEAKMEGDRLMYKGDDGKWVNYDVRWKTEDERLTKDWKTKQGDTKIKVGKDGDVKVKDESGKTKYDADDNKVKKDSSR